MAMSKIKLVGMLSVLTVASVMGQSSCVQLNSTQLSSCPCEDATLTFTLEGETTIAANTVNLAVVLDGSGSISSSDFSLEQGFAEDAVAAFAARQMFDNGGMASYVQYSGRLASSGTFGSEKEFNDFARADKQAEKGTTTSIGIDEGTRLLGVNPASASFMIVITDGRSRSITATKRAAEAARADGIIVLAVGVGKATDSAELLAIGGDAANIFEVADFDRLKAALELILSSGGGIDIPCESTGATLTIDFIVPVDSAPSGSISRKTVTFWVADLESTPADFEVMLDACNKAPGGSIIASADYNDDQGNTPDLSLLTGMVIGNDFCTAPTPAPTAVPTTSPTPKATKRPDINGTTNVGEATDSEYLGCYVPKDKATPLNGPVITWSEMTAQACSDFCNCSDWEYFATAKGSDCLCGSAEPGKNKKAGVCDYPCGGDSSTACGGLSSISVYISKKFGNP